MYSFEICCDITSLKKVSRYPREWYIDDIAIIVAALLIGVHTYNSAENILRVFEFFGPVWKISLINKQMQ